MIHRALLLGLDLGQISASVVTLKIATKPNSGTCREADESRQARPLMDAAVGLAEVSRPTPRRAVMRIEF